MFECDRGCRLDLRTHPLEFAGAIGLGDGGVRPAVRRIDRLARPVGLGRAHLLGRTVRVVRPIDVARVVGLDRTDNLGRTVRVGRTILKAAGLNPGDGDPMEDDLVASGRFVRIETRGEHTGLPRTVTVGFVEDAAPPPGALLVAAGSVDAAWARNLIAEPSCRVTVGDRSFDAVAAPLGPSEHARAIRELILHYGTPAEGLGRGPSFRLRPAGEGGR